MIALCTDSASQIPPDLAARYGVAVVPIPVEIDGASHLEGVDIDADDFWRRFADGAQPAVSTSQPSPGEIAAVYRRLADDGADQILSIHTGGDVSGTINSARIAAGVVDVEVRLVDSGTASFGVACCVWEAAEAIGRGADLAAAASIAETTAPTIGNVFVVGALDLARAGGRLADAAAVADVPILSLRGGELVVLGEAREAAAAVEVMAAAARAHGSRLRAAVGIADAGAAPIGDALLAELDGAPEIVDVVRYRVGPSIGAHTGPGTAGAFYYPVAGA